MKLFSIKDMKSQMFAQPHAQRSVADAIRSFSVIASEGENMVAKFPNDFRLFHLADFDVESGELTVLERMSDLGSAADHIAAKKPDPTQLDAFRAAASN